MNNKTICHHPTNSLFKTLPWNQETLRIEDNILKKGLGYFTVGCFFPNFDNQCCPGQPRPMNSSAKRSQPGPSFGGGKDSCVGQNHAKHKASLVNRIDWDSRQKNLKKIRKSTRSQKKARSGRNHHQLLVNFHHADKSKKGTTTKYRSLASLATFLTKKGNIWL
jgi:hypothetical protein